LRVQASEASVATLADQYGINPKTAHKWKKRESVEDFKCGAKPGQGSVLADVDEAAIVETRLKTLLPLDDLYDVLLPLIPALTRSNLQRHGISRLADLLPPEEKAETKKFKAYAPGYLHVDTAQINLGKDKWCLFVSPSAQLRTGVDRAIYALWVRASSASSRTIYAPAGTTGAWTPPQASWNGPWPNTRLPAGHKQGHQAVDRQWRRVQLFILFRV
jgi:hypothetical protein